MARKAKGPKRNIWDDPSPYGTYEGELGNEDQWSEAFKEAWGMGDDIARKVVGDSSPWAVLGVPEGSTLAVVKAAFYRLVMLHHPDKGGDAEKCKEVIAAWTVLKSKLA
jgi:DnaJ-class molecular chaperone